METKMDYEIEIIGKAALIKMPGDFSIFSKGLLDEIFELNGEKKIQYFAFDLSNTKRVDSVGMLCILEAGRLGLENGRKAALIRTHERIRNTIQKAGLSRFAEFFEEREAALGYLRTN